MSSALADRVDFELARAREWRNGELHPLATSLEVESSLRRDGIDGGGPSLAIVRARRLLREGETSPGEIADQWLDVVTALLALLAAVAGAKLAVTVLGDPAVPVNVVWFLVHGLGLQTISLFLTLLLLLPAVPGLGWLRRLSGETLSLGALVLSAVVRFAGRGHGKETIATGHVRGRMRSLAALRPLLFVVSTCAWLSFNAGFLAASGLALSAQHHVFSWQTTLLTDEAKAGYLLQRLTAPATIWPGQVSAAQIEVSRYLPSERRFATDGGDPVLAASLRGAWSIQLLAAVIGWAVLPRFALLFVALALWRRARPRMEPETTDPYVEAVVRRLLPTVATTTSQPPKTPVDDRTRAREERSATEAPTTWYVATHLGAARGSSPVAALWGRERTGWHSLPRLDGRAGADRALEEISRDHGEGRGFALLVDYGTTPDRSLLRLLSRLREQFGPAAPMFVILTGGASFRTTRLGGLEGSIARRRQIWTDALGAASVSELLDFDATNATSIARRKLEETLGVTITESAAPPTAIGFERALRGIDTAASSWLGQLDEARDPEREELRLIAAARVAIDQQFGRDPNDGREAKAGAMAAGLATGLKTVVAGAIETTRDAHPRGVEIAAASIASFWGITKRIATVDPRYVVAGIAAGLVAGPLGGAIAAGASGLIAGASLSTTLATVGGALGGVLGAEPADSPERVKDASSDRLGLVSRSAVIHALVLAHQGKTEPEIAEVLSSIVCQPEAQRAIDSVSDVRALTRIALEKGLP